MIQFLLGIILGIVISVNGFSGLVKAIDHGVDEVKTLVQERS